MQSSRFTVAISAITLGLGLVYGSCGAKAAVSTSSMSVSATVIASCVVSKTSSHMNSAQPDVNCSNAAPYRVETVLGNASVQPSTGRIIDRAAGATVTTITY